MTSLFSMVEAALYTALSANPNLAAAVGTNIFDTAPDIPPAPDVDYVIFQQQGGGGENVMPRDSVEVVYRVEYISSTHANAQAGAGYIRDTLHEKFLSLPAGWTNWRMQEDRWFNQTDSVEGRLYYRKGALYRINIDNE